MQEQPFELVTQYQPAGDQPQAIEKLVHGIEKGMHDQLLLGVTGSGKTYTMANVIARTQRPTIIMAHNKTLAAQLYGEFKAFFPHNAVEYFVSYYDYYQLKMKKGFLKILSLKKIPQLTTILTRCGFPRHVHC